MLSDLIYNFFLSEVTILFIDVIALYLVFLVYREAREPRLKALYFMMTFCMLLWVNAAYLPRLISAENYQLGLALLKIAWFATPLLFVFIYLFTVHLIDKQHAWRPLNIIVILLGSLSALLTGFTDKILIGTQYVDEILTIVYGDWMYPFLLAVFLIMLATLIPPIKTGAYRNKQFQHFIVGVGIFYLANLIFNITFPIFFGFARFYFFGDYSTLILLGFTAYGMIKYKFFNIKVIATEILIVAIWLVLSIEILTADNWADRSLKIASLFLVVLLSILLIKSVRQEVEQREKMASLTSELKTANKHLKKLDEAKTEFISVASHQLRTPLSGIKGYLSMLIDGDFGKVKPEQHKIMQDVFANTERLIRLVNVFLNVSRIESGRLKLVKKKFDLKDLVINVTNQLQLEADSKGLKLKTNLPGDFCEVTADPDKITDVLVNLTDNSIKYTQAGFVTVSLEKQNKKYLVSVTDTGVGISKSEIKELFIKFKRGKKISQVSTSGSGLGLFIAKKIITLHGGKIWAESPGEGKGSTFKFEFPV